MATASTYTPYRKDVFGKLFQTTAGILGEKQQDTRQLFEDVAAPLFNTKITGNADALAQYVSALENTASELTGDAKDTLAPVVQAARQIQKGEKVAVKIPTLPPQLSAKDKKKLEELKELGQDPKLGKAFKPGVAPRPLPPGMG